MDNKLLKMLKDGNDTALKSLFDVYYTRLCIYSVQITESMNQSEDIVQDLFIKLWEKKLYCNITNLSQYLFNAVQYESIAFIKKNRRCSIEELEDLSYSPIDEQYDEEDLKIRRDKLYKALEKLSPQEYKVLTAIILNGKKYKEVAEELKISTNTVKTHLSRALKLLRSEKTLTFFFYSIF